MNLKAKELDAIELALPAAQSGSTVNGSPQDFDYSSFDASQRKELQKHATAIRGLLQQTGSFVIEIGCRLREVHHRVTFPQFKQWVLVEFGWGFQKALRYIQATDRFEGLDCADQLKPTALIELSRENVPQPAVDEVLERTRAGQRVTLRDIHSTIAKHKPDKPQRGEKRPKAVSQFRWAVDQLGDRVETLAQSLTPAQLDELAEDLLQLALDLRASQRSASGD